MRFRLHLGRTVAILLAGVLLVSYAMVELLSQGMVTTNRAPRALPKVILNRPLPKVQFEDLAAKSGLLARHVTGADNE